MKARECRHCGRTIVRSGDLWVDPEATGDDLAWRETCDAHDTMTADHEPVLRSEQLRQSGGWILWGAHPAYVDGTPIKLSAGTIAECRAERDWRTAEPDWPADPWQTEITRQGKRPRVLDALSAELASAAFTV